MTGKEMLIVERRLIDKVDEYRGDLDREDFIKFCIDGCLEGVEGPAKEKEEIEKETGEEPPYASRKEFIEFKQGVRQILTAFLDFFVTFGLEMGNIKTSTELRKLKEQLRLILKEY